jgi:D-alanyl-D-alanine endopeptidase (penicillin-binding protein 7)
MLKVLEGIFGMYLNRLSILILTVVFACGASLNAPAIAASQDVDKKTKTSKAAVNNTKTTITPNCGA